MKKRKKYTEEDIDFLRKHYPDGDWNAIFQRFSLSSKAPIYDQCHKYGIASNNEHRKNFNIANTRKKWSDNEISILKDNYSKATMEELQKLLPERTIHMIRTKANVLKLISNHRLQAIWKDSELEYIKDNWELTPDKIMADKMGRTFRSVKAKREELGLYRRNPCEISYPTIAKYLRGQNQKWKNDSMKACDYKCVLTGSKNFDIHHLYGVSNMINDIFEKRPIYKDKSFSDYSESDLSLLTNDFLNLQNEYPLGVCVDKKIHIVFHSMYGQYYNTPSQWYKFCEDYKKGVYDKYI